MFWCSRFAGGYGNGGYNGFYGGGFLMMIPMLLIVGLIVYLIYRLFSNRNVSYNTGVSTSKALEILDERFARGEIDAEEYTAKKKSIGK